MTPTMLGGRSSRPGDAAAMVISGPPGPVKLSARALSPADLERLGLSRDEALAAMRCVLGGRPPLRLELVPGCDAPAGSCVCDDGVEYGRRLCRCRTYGGGTWCLRICSRL